MTITSKKISSALHSAINTKTLLLSSTLSSALLIIGCQSNGLVQSNMMMSSQTPLAAKTTLATALQKQRRQSFMYHGSIEISNDQQFSDIDREQLVASDDVDMHCEEGHDNAYAALLKQAAMQNKDIIATDYSVQRLAIKQSYLECAEAYNTWSDGQINDDESEGDADYEGYDDYDNLDHYESDDSAYYERQSLESDEALSGSNRSSRDSINNEAVTISESRMVAKDGNKVIASSDASENGLTVPPYYQQLFDSYEEKSTALDVKKAQLLDAYLLKPLSINAQGIYQPMAGKFTMLASMQYKGRNHHTSINQPIYMDFKTGNIYFWADNFAIFNSEVLDNKLGTTWRNKWLKLSIDDGTLPKGFGRSVIKAHFEALDRTYESAEISQFDFITPNTVATLSPALPEKHLAPMLQSKQIIRRTQSGKSYDQFDQQYMSAFYDIITTQYPELINDDSTSDNLGTNEKSFTSKAVVQQILNAVKKGFDSDTENDSVDSPNGNDTLGAFKAFQKRNNSMVQELYGLDSRGNIQWQHIRDQDVNSDNANKGMVMDIMQRYSPLSQHTVAFPNLPADSQVPNASNSIDIRQYSKELVQYYRDGNGTTMGKLLFRMLPTDDAQTTTD